MKTLNLHQKLIPIAPLFLTILAAGIIPPWTAIAQTVQIGKSIDTDSNNREKAEKFLEEATTLIGTNDRFFYGLVKYMEALAIYREIDDTEREVMVRQQLEKILAENQELADRKRDDLLQARSEFIRQFPAVNDNQTALELQKIAATQFGLIFKTNPQAIEFAIDREIAEKFAEIKDGLDEYWNAQINNPSNQLTALPENLKAYLKLHTDDLDHIRKLLSDDGSIQLFFDPSFLDFETALPSYLNLINLQKILLLDAIAQFEADETDIMLANLDAAWKLNQSLQNNPTIIGQLVSLIGTKYNAGILKKLEDLPSQWQERLLSHDYRKSILQSLQSEAYSLSAYSLLRFEKLKPEEAVVEQLENLGEDMAKFLLDAGWEELSLESQKKFLQFAVINLAEESLKIYRSLENHNICQMEVSSFLKSWGLTQPDINFLRGYVTMWMKGGQAMLNLELTEKVLQLQSQVSEADGFPQQLSSQPASICPDTNWVYRVQSDRTITLDLDPHPSAFNDENSAIYLILPFSFVVD